MIINLSNHPSVSWQASQLHAARTLFGQVEDWPFPTIDPNLDTPAVENLAEDYAQKIVDKRVNAVHLMGELSFCFSLAAKLQKAQVMVYVSTSHRQVEWQGDQKIVQFKFVQFRPYPKLL